MTRKVLLVLVMVMVMVLLVSPVAAKVVTAKVDDKGLIGYGTGGLVLVGTLHTAYGTITVKDGDYNSVEINDTIRYDTVKDTFWGPYWDIEVIT